MQTKIGQFFLFVFCFLRGGFLCWSRTTFLSVSTYNQRELFEMLIRVLFKPRTLSLSSKSYRLIGVLFQKHVLLG